MHKLLFFISVRILFLCPILFSIVWPASGFDKEFIGKLAPKISVNCDEIAGVIFKPSDSPQLRRRFTRADKITFAKLYYPPSGKPEMLGVLVERRGARPALYVDVNLDLKFEKHERYPMKRAPGGEGKVYEAMISIPIRDSYFKTLPFCLKYFPGLKTAEMGQDDRFLSHTVRPFARGKVNIDGRPTSVIYRYNAKTKSILATRGLVGIDADQDGKVDMNPLSPEVAEAHNESVVFRVGDHYVSTKSIDLESRRIVLRAHTAEEYRRIELKVGVELPDFDFTDFEGKHRRLSEFRGRYVLLDFWGTWCRACHRDTAGLLRAYRRFHSKGFEVLGMNTDEPETLGAVKLWLEQNDLRWPQATLDSIRTTLDRYRIQIYPSTILIGPDGRIVSLNQTEKGQLSLRGESLATTLERLIPPEK